VVSPDGVVPSWMVGVSASVNLPLHRKVQKFSSGTGSPWWSRKRAVERLRCGVVVVNVSVLSAVGSILFEPVCLLCGYRDLRSPVLGVGCTLVW